VPPNRVTVSVRDGQVILKGTLDWQYQKGAAARTVRNRAGVRVTNEIVVEPHLKAGDIQTMIEAAFKRSAGIDARRVKSAFTTARSR
jgi:osmotically-inducible protein OsmY